ncbi:alginate lyase family protein [Rhizohabitans arisaemae]|uniref:alginate lyase family protein n=1 Tax=Rhizohabitans arisaemae TaxID=2720610 RepID=UPI0024B1E38E|nr:alginate lyase family protein [Rhizohabitans arisaemae]
MSRRTTRRGVHAGLGLSLGAALVVAAIAPGTTVDATSARTVSAAVTVAPSTFKHPGVLVSGAQLDFVRQKVKAGAEPWTSAFDAMRRSGLASLAYRAKPRAVVECGSGSNPNLGCTDERNDALAAYTHALMWSITKDARHARKAAEIMDAWSAVIRDHTNGNAPLQTGWAGASWARAAELIRHTSTVWPAARSARFGAMLRRVYLPEIENGAPDKNGNWELIMMDAVIGIAVFLEDRARFDKAVQIWRGRVPAYVYLKSDGVTPKSPPNSRWNTPERLVRYWQGQSTYVDGLAQETCRDFGHSGWGLAAMAHVAETAHHQGIDLYSEVRGRLDKAFGFHTRYENGTAVPDWLCGGRVQLGLGAVTEVAYNHYAGRLGMNMPQTKRFTEAARPAGPSHFLAWETLTHAGTP